MNSDGIEQTLCEVHATMIQELFERGELTTQDRDEALGEIRNVYNGGELHESIKEK